MAVINIDIFIFLSIFVGWTPFTNSSWERWAVLVAGSQGWKNYRHQANVCEAYKILRKGGLKKERIIVFMYDDIAYNPQNPEPGKIYTQRNGHDVYRGVLMDYTGEHVTVENFYNVLRGQRSDITRKVLKSGSHDHVFIYFTDHGNLNTLYMPQEGDEVHREDFLSVLNYMHRAKLYKRMVIYVDACRSGSMFEDAEGLDYMNIFVITSANSSEFCYGDFEDLRWNTSLHTMFSAAWMEDSKKHNLRWRTFNEQYEWVRRRVGMGELTSHVMKYGSQRIGRKYVSEFFRK